MSDGLGIHDPHNFCPECEQVSPVAAWVETEVGCSDCGSHPAAFCPDCMEKIDLVFHPDIELAP